MGREYIESEIGIARHAWVDKPDTKYNAEGLYHMDIIYAGETAEKVRAGIDAKVEEALAAHQATMAPAKAKQWTAHYPYTVEEDPDTGAPTGRLIVRFKQNATIHFKDGSTKQVEIGIRDAANKETNLKVFSGDKVAALYSPRVVTMETSKKIGLRLGKIVGLHPCLQLHRDS